MDDFVHLHVHSMGSLLDGLPTADEIIDRVLELEQPAVALTDHGSMANALQFNEAAKKAGIKPLIGIEGYITEDLTIKEKETNTYHIGMIAKNDEGLKNLYKLSDIAWNKGFYKKPRIDLNALNEHREGVIVLSGCMDGAISHHIRKGREDLAVAWHRQLSEVVDDFYIEIQPWNPEGLNEALIEINNDARPVVVTADTHYCKQDDKFAEEVALLIQLSSQDKKPSEKRRLESLFEESRKIPDEFNRIDFLYPERKLSFKDIDNYLMTRRNLETRFPDHHAYLSGEYFSNTVALADSVSSDIPTHRDYFPIFSSSMGSDEILREVAYEGLQRLHLQDKPEYVERLEDELTVITRLNFSDYILVTWDTVAWAKSNNIYVGPGRGSAGGSLLAYVLNITEVDPLEYGLLFWRFLNVSVEYRPEFEEV